MTLMPDWLWWTWRKKLAIATMTWPKWPTTWRKMYALTLHHAQKEERLLLTWFVFVFVPQVKILPLFKSQNKFEPMVGGQKLEMENILVYYVDEEAPTFTMQNLSGGIIAVIVVVVLVVVIGLVVLVSARISRFVFVQVLYELTGLVSCFLRSSSSESATGSGTTKLRWVVLSCPVLIYGQSWFPDNNKTLWFSHSKERWSPCKVLILAGVGAYITADCTVRSHWECAIFTI